MHSRPINDPFIESLLVAAQALNDGKAHITTGAKAAPSASDFSQPLWLASIHSPQSVRLFVRGKERLLSPLLHASDRYQTYLNSLDDGFTLVIDGISTLCSAWARVARLLHLASGTRVSVNVYITPAYSSGFVRHSDPHDVLVVQLHGRKCWNIERIPQQRILEPGDILAIPFGCAHEAKASDEPSIHVTLGMHRDVDILVMQTALAEAVLECPDLRSATVATRLQTALTRVASISDQQLALRSPLAPTFPGEQDILDRLNRWKAELHVNLEPTPLAECHEADGGVLINLERAGGAADLFVECDRPAAVALKHAFEGGQPLKPQKPPHGTEVREWLQLLKVLRHENALVPHKAFRA